MGVNFTDTQFTFSTFTLLSASAHLCPLSCSPRPSAEVTHHPRPLSSPLSPSNMSLYLSYSLFSFPLLKANLASFPVPGPLPPLSLALLS